MSTGVNRATLRDWREHPEKALNRATCPRCADSPRLPERVWWHSAVVRGDAGSAGGGVAVLAAECHIGGAAGGGGAAGWVCRAEVL